MRTTGRSAVRRLLIPADEAALIKYQIELIARPAIVKSGLQRLCSHLEAGRLLTDPGPLRNTIVGLVFTGSPLVRRWCYKALAYLGKPDDIVTLSEKMRTESDPENQTWIMSAIFSLSRAGTVLDVCREAGAEYSDAMALAALLYGKGAINRIGADLPKVNVDTADPLTLKWCALLAGYEKAPPNLLHPHYENRALLGALNAHDAAEVAEYSVWALWKSPEFTMDDLAIQPHQYLSQPENVRRWTNRLIAQTPSFLAANLDLFDDLYDDAALKAREGLALGIRDVHIPELQPHVMQWYGQEIDTDLREIILEHMDVSDDGDTDLFDLLYDQYNRAEAEGSLRRRLRAAVSGRSGKLFQAFRSIDAASYVIGNSAALFANDQSQGSLLTMSTNNTTFNIGRDLNAQNVAGGDMVAIANESVQQLKQEDAGVANVLEQIIALAREKGAFTAEQSTELLVAVDAVAKEPSQENKGKLLDKMKALAGVVSVASAATKLPELIAVVSSWF